MKNRGLLFCGHSTKVYTIEQCLDESKQLASWLLVFRLNFWLLVFFTRGPLLGRAIGLSTFLAACFLAAGFLGDFFGSRLPGDLLLGHLSGHLTKTEASICTSAFELLQAGVLHSSAEGQISRDLTAFSSGPTEKFFMMYFNMSWRDEPPLSIILEMAS